MMMAAKALLDRNPDPTEEDIRWALSGNLCRCTAAALHRLPEHLDFPPPRLKPGDSSRHRLGFLFHSRLRTGCPVPSDISSAGIAGVAPGYGKTCRKNVLRRVDVPVVPGAAGRALPRPGAQAEFGEQMPARRARLAGGVPAVDHDQAPPVLGCLVFQLAAELAPSRVESRPVQPGFGASTVREVCAWPVRVRPGLRPPGQVRDRQVFDHDRVVVADQPGAGAVEEVNPGGADFPVRAGRLRLRLPPVRGPFPAAGQAALVAGREHKPGGPASADWGSSPRPKSPRRT